MLNCLSPKILSFPRGAYLLRAGAPCSSAGLLLSGRALIIQEDFWGNRNVLAALTPGQIFAESFACASGTPLTVSVAAEEDVRAAFLDFQRMLAACPSSCPCHSRLLRNLLAVLAEKNLSLNEKLTHMGQRTTRDKLLSYLSAQARRQGSPRFRILFSRQQLADYLCVDRSGLSAELGRLRDEGMLSFQRDQFVLLSPP